MMGKRVWVDMQACRQTGTEWILEKEVERKEEVAQRSTDAALEKRIEPTHVNTCSVYLKI